MSMLVFKPSVRVFSKVIPVLEEGNRVNSVGAARAFCSFGSLGEEHPARKHIPKSTRQFR
ncbi:hypothetical protein ADIS_0671 [Lunatimonas lonarensis]|uniref:Uncharacterized protein n=1 Tax=Lunatimonas lonarensis TaxID=1232681 RepID=R7ZXQ8_9BACT|nr:hypothetical protein ADIS_0671 [Lunatimonas lonarensis]